MPINEKENKFFPGSMTQCWAGAHLHPQGCPANVKLLVPLPQHQGGCLKAPGHAAFAPSLPRVAAAQRHHKMFDPKSSTFTSGRKKQTNQPNPREAMGLLCLPPPQMEKCGLKLGPLMG